MEVPDSYFVGDGGTPQSGHAVRRTATEVWNEAQRRSRNCASRGWAGIGRVRIDPRTHSDGRHRRAHSHGDVNQLYAFNDQLRSLIRPYPALERCLVRPPPDQVPLFSFVRRLQATAEPRRTAREQLVRVAGQGPAKEMGRLRRKASDGRTSALAESRPVPAQQLRRRLRRNRS